MIRVLHVVGQIPVGGVGAFLFNVSSKLDGESRCNLVLQCFQETRKAFLLKILANIMLLTLCLSMN